MPEQPTVFDIKHKLDANSENYEYRPIEGTSIVGYMEEIHKAELEEERREAERREAERKAKEAES